MLGFDKGMRSFGCAEGKGNAFPPMNASGWGGAGGERIGMTRTDGAAFASKILGAVENDSAEDNMPLWVN